MTPSFSFPETVVEPKDVDTETVLLEGFCEIPTIRDAWTMPSAIGGINIQVLYGQRDLANNAVRRFMSTVHVPVSVIMGAAPTMIPSLPWQLRPDVVMTSPSPSGQRMLVVRQETGENAKDKPTTIEVWGGGRLLKEVEVPPTIHGAVFNEGWFAKGCAWNMDETRVVYVAEAAPAEKTPEWGGFTAGARTIGKGKAPGNGSGRNEAVPEDRKSKAKAKTWRGKGAMGPSWGEAYQHMRLPHMFLLDLSSWEVEPVGDLDPNLSCGQMQWSRDGTHLVFVGWDLRPENIHTHRQLGIIYCMNRPAKLYAVRMDVKRSAPVCLTESLLSAHSPRFTPDGSVIVFLSHEKSTKSGLHNGTAALKWLKWTDPSGVAGPEVARASEISTMIDVVGTPATADDFPGLYTPTLPTQPFLQDGRTVVMDSQWRHASAIITVDTMTGQVNRISPAPPAMASWQLLDVYNDMIVARMSDPSTPDVLMTAKSSNGTWIWESIRVAVPEPLHVDVEQALGRIDYCLLATPARPLESTTSSYPPTVETIVISDQLVSDSGQVSPRPTVLVPHGGPHGAFTTSYVMYYSFLASLGYTVLMVNFRGSTGYGEDFVQALPGHVGKYDVGDCIAALEAACEAGLVDASRVAVCGGSHGGFLAGHLLGQHPDRFRCGIMRNPVCNIALMTGVSDIPDWCFVETFGSEEGLRRFRVDPTVDDLQEMLAKSPIRYADKVRAPVLMLLGARDARVPPKDALQYVYALRDKTDATEVRVLMFPEDKHDLGTPQTEFESWINVASWLKTHMS
jgi:acylaminoacyl-peptidase